MSGLAASHEENGSGDDRPADIRSLDRSADNFARAALFKQGGNSRCAAARRGGRLRMALYGGGGPPEGRL